MSDLASRVRLARRAVDQEYGQAKAVIAEAKKAQTDVASLAAKRDLLAQATALLSTIGEERQAEAQLKVEGLVTHALKMVFGEELSFHLIAGTRGNQAITDFVVRSTMGDGTVVDTPVMDARGGGLAAVVGFLLRLVVILLSPVAPVLFLDETFAHLSEEYLAPLGEFLHELVERTEVQIVMVTHQSEFAAYADRAYRFSVKGGATQVEELTT